jgi:hypothetical protein
VGKVRRIPPLGSHPLDDQLITARNPRDLPAGATRSDKGLHARAERWATAKGYAIRDWHVDVVIDDVGVRMPLCELAPGRVVLRGKAESPCDAAIARRSTSVAATRHHAGVYR